MHWLLCDCLWHWLNMLSPTSALSSSMWLPAVNLAAVSTDRSDYVDWYREREVMLQINNLNNRGCWSVELYVCYIYTFIAADQQPPWLPLQTSICRLLGVSHNDWRLSTSEFIFFQMFLGNHVWCNSLSASVNCIFPVFNSACTPPFLQCVLWSMLIRFLTIW